MEMSIRGERFGKLVVIGLVSEIRNGCHTVLCRWDCGKTTQVSAADQTSGNVKR